MILENTFTSMSEMVSNLYPYLGFLKWIVLRNYWPSEERIKEIHTPMLFISGRQDELVPPYMMDRLYDSANKTEFKDMVHIEFGTHNSVW